MVVESQLSRNVPIIECRTKFLRPACGAIDVCWDGGTSMDPANRVVASMSPMRKR